MKDGFRQQKGKSKKDQVKELAIMVQNLQMATKVMQIGMQQLGESFGRIDQDISKSMGVLNDLQYRTLAMIDSGKFDKEELDKVAVVLKLADYTEASDKEDIDKGYTIADIIEDESVVILTSTCEEDSTKAIFRTKFKLDESGNPEAEEKLVGLKVGDKVGLKLGGIDHEVEVIGIRTVPVEPEIEVINGDTPEGTVLQTEEVVAQ